ncbi:hypothetical protein BDA99DRAFT_296545 [Phascolomyces articulosus]|uniref:Uncharacterized protein n=1 Tax=Phascolomyces articulosus TaxID=60185 RepID=A0AAD5JL68_9FUNG|nr:hypothetical protein BDA99DRAFT_296545 [Phascolomyces articulosus]
MCLLTQLPFIILGNAILMAAGYNDYIQDISPDVPPHKIHTIAINPAIIYETLTPHEYGIPQGPFQVTPVGSGKPITSSAARKDGDAMWWSFFDHTKVKKLCDMHKMVFANRMVVRPDKTVSLLGTIKNNHTPIISEYEKRQKKKRNSKKSSYVNILPHLAGKSKSQLEQDLQSVEGSITELQTTQIELKKQAGQATKAWQTAKDELKKSKGKVKQLLSKKLKDDVQEKRKANSLLKLAQRKIKDFRSMKYQLNKAVNHYGKNDPPSSVPPTTPTPTRMQHEDISANIDVSKLDMNKCVYGATDYGHVVLSQTVPLTNNNIRFHVDLYNKQ